MGQQPLQSFSHQPHEDYHDRGNEGTYNGHSTASQETLKSYRLKSIIPRRKILVLKYLDVCSITK